MALPNDASVQNIRWSGPNEDQVPPELRQEIVEKILDYARRPNVKATVVITERLPSIDPPDEDLVQVAICNGTYYFVLVNEHFTLRMLLHNVRNDVISAMLAWPVVRL